MSVRTLRLTSPHMKGGDVRLFQRSLQHRLTGWQVPTKIAIDGEYGPQTDRIARKVAHGLGLTGAELAHGFTAGIRRKIHDPQRLTPTEHRRAVARRQWVKRWAQAARSARHGALTATDYARKMLGTVEHPSGSNRGPRIDVWNRAVGTPPGPSAYWCGAFCNACLVAAGLPPQHFMAYCPAIEAHARAGIDGWAWHGPETSPQKGWLALFTEGSVAGHVELVVANGSPLNTIGGNTSKGDGSPNNSGGVFAHDFSHYRGLPLRGFAAPNYSH
jgi:hypothetical protein